MYLCPRCHQGLTQEVTTRGIFWNCDKCGGKAMGFGVLRKTIGPQRMADVLGPAVTGHNRDGCACPMCSLPMTAVTVDVNEEYLLLDLCQPCGFIWFDAGEFESLPGAPPPPHVLGEIDPDKMTPEAREKLAMIEIKQLADEARAQDPTPDEEWKAIPAVLGLPVEMEASESMPVPWATYLLSLVITGISLAAFTNLQPIVDQYGLIPTETWRDHGLTLFTSFFLHVGWVHLLGNLYFLIVFGRAVENDLGPWRWLLLVLLATQAGNLLLIIGNPDGSLPCIGASGGISGLLAYYALKFPEVRLGMLLRFYVYFRWIQFPAWTAFVFWVLFQIYGEVSQRFSHSIGGIGYLAHLGGVIPGIIFWLWARNRPSASASTAITNPVQVKVE